MRASWASVAEESTALGSAVAGSFTAVYRPVVNTTEAVSRYVQISTGQLDPALIASARAAQVLALAQRDLAAETAAATRAEAESAAERAAFLARAAASTERMSVATREAIEAEALAAQVNAEKLGVYARDRRDRRRRGGHRGRAGRGRGRGGRGPVQGCDGGDGRRRRGAPRSPGRG